MHFLRRAYASIFGVSIRPTIAFWLYIAIFSSLNEPVYWRFLYRVTRKQRISIECICYGPMSVCLFVTNRCFIETAERIELVFGTEAALRTQQRLRQLRLPWRSVERGLHTVQIRKTSCSDVSRRSPPPPPPWSRRPTHPLFTPHRLSFSRLVRID